MRKWALLAIVALACSKSAPVGTSLTGAPSARDAALQFMGAVKAQDLQAMGAVWGSDKGAARDNMDRTELDKRLVILQQCYDHDRAQMDSAWCASRSRGAAEPRFRSSRSAGVPRIVGTCSTPTTSRSRPISAVAANKRPPDRSVLAEFDQNPAG